MLSPQSTFTALTVSVIASFTGWGTWWCTLPSSSDSELDADVEHVQTERVDPLSGTMPLPAGEEVQHVSAVVDLPDARDAEGAASENAGSWQSRARDFVAAAQEIINESSAQLGEHWLRVRVPIDLAMAQNSAHEKLFHLLQIPEITLVACCSIIFLVIVGACCPRRRTPNQRKARDDALCDVLSHEDLAVVREELGCTIAGIAMEHLEQVATSTSGKQVEATHAETERSGSFIEHADLKQAPCMQVGMHDAFVGTAELEATWFDACISTDIDAAHPQGCASPRNMEGPAILVEGTQAPKEAVQEARSADCGGTMSAEVEAMEAVRRDAVSRDDLAVAHEEPCCKVGGLAVDGCMVGRASGHQEQAVKGSVGTDQVEAMHGETERSDFFMQHGDLQQARCMSVGMHDAKVGADCALADIDVAQSQRCASPRDMELLTLVEETRAPKEARQQERTAEFRNTPSAEAEAWAPSCCVLAGLHSHAVSEPRASATPESPTLASQGVGEERSGAVHVALEAEALSSSCPANGIPLVCYRTSLLGAAEPLESDEAVMDGCSARQEEHAHRSRGSSSEFAKLGHDEPATLCAPTLVLDETPTSHLSESVQRMEIPQSWTESSSPVMTDADSLRIFRFPTTVDVSPPMQAYGVSAEEAHADALRLFLPSDVEVPRCSLPGPQRDTDIHMHAHAVSAGVPAVESGVHQLLAYSECFPMAETDSLRRFLPAQSTHAQEERPAREGARRACRAPAAAEIDALDIDVALPFEDAERVFLTFSPKGSAYSPCGSYSEDYGGIPTPTRNSLSRPWRLSRPPSRPPATP